MLFTENGNHRRAFSGLIFSMFTALWTTWPAREATSSTFHPKNTTDRRRYATREAGKRRNLNQMHFKFATNCIASLYFEKILSVFTKLHCLSFSIFQHGYFQVGGETKLRIELFTVCWKFPFAINVDKLDKKLKCWLIV